MRANSGNRGDRFLTIGTLDIALVPLQASTAIEKQHNSVACAPCTRLREPSDRNVAVTGHSAGSRECLVMAVSCLSSSMSIWESGLLEIVRTGTHTTLEPITATPNPQFGPLHARMRSR
jgi:hypothetical protein